MSSLASGGAFRSAHAVGNTVTLNLPGVFFRSRNVGRSAEWLVLVFAVIAVAVHCFDSQQASGALYGACLNCDIVGTSRLDIVDAHNEPSGGAYGM